MDYDLEAQADAAEDLAPLSAGGSGQVVVITTPGSSTVDPGTDQLSVVAAKTQQGSGIEINSRAQSIAGTLVQSGDKQLMLSPARTDGPLISTPVADRDTVTLADGSCWSIKAVDTVSPAGRPIFHTLLLRR